MTQEKYSESMSFTEESQAEGLSEAEKKEQDLLRKGVYSKREEEFKKPAQQYRYGKR